jgi:hypothetical protein
MNKYVSGAISVEVALDAPQGTNFRFPEIPLLRGKRIKHIDFCAIANAPSGKACVTNINSFITLVEVNTQIEMIQNLHTSNLSNHGNRLYINKIIDLQRSFVSLPGAVLDEINEKVLLFVFWFDEPTNRNFVPKELNRNSINSIELQLTGNKTFFDENLKLKNKMIQNLYLTYPLFSANGNAGVAQPNIENKFLTLSRNNVEFFRQVPLYLFFQSENYYPLRLQNIQFDFQNSYIETLTTTANDLKTVFFNCIIDENK